MGLGKIKQSDLIEENAIKGIITDAANLETQLKAILTINTEILKNNPFKTAKDVEQFEASIQATTAATKALNDVEKIQVEQKKKLKELTDEEIKAQIEQQEINKERRNRLKEELKLAQENLGTLEKLTLQNAKLTKERKTLNLDTKEGTRRLKEINKELDANNKRIKENSDKLSQQRLNVGNYTKSIIGAFKSTGVLKKATVTLASTKNKLASGLGGVTKASTLTSKAMYTIPIFMLIGAITQLVAWFSSTQEGAEALERIFAAVSTTINVLVDRLSKAGGAIMDFVRGKKSWSEMNEVLKESMTGIIDEIVIEIKAVDDLTVAYQNLERAKVSQIVKSKKLELEIARLRRDAADEETYNTAQRRKMIKEAADLENELFDMQIDKAKEEARIEAGKYEFSKKLNADLQKKEEAEAHLLELEAQKQEAQKSVLKELNKLRKEDLANKKAYEDGQIKLIEASKKAEKDRTDEFLKEVERRQKIAEAASNKQIETLKKQASEREKEFKADQTRRKMEKDELAKLAAVRTEIAQKSTETLMANLKTQTAFTKAQTDRQISLTQDRIGREQQLANLGFENRLADQEAQAAKLEAQRIRQERRQMQLQKALAFIEAFRGFLKDGDNPGSASAKAGIVMAAIQASLGSFYEGTENVAESLGKPHLPTKRDGYVIRVDGQERIFKPQHNKILTPYSNEDVVDIVQAHKSGANNQYISTLTDRRIVEELRNVQRTISNIDLAVNWDEHDRRIERKIKDQTKTVVKTVTSRPRL